MSTLLQEGEFFHGRALVCRGWELRITERCLTEDLARSGDTSFEDVAGEPVVRAFIRERRAKTTSARKVEPLTHGREVAVIGQGHDHRGGTWFDREHNVIWLLAYGLHRSGRPDDFFPQCKQLDEDDRLLPNEADYELLFKDQGERFAKSVLVGIPLLLKRARQVGEEVSAVIGGEFGVTIAVETADELESITVAFDTQTMQVYSHIPAILGALRPGGDWEDADSMPSRTLSDTEIAFCCTGETLSSQ